MLELCALYFYVCYSAVIRHADACLHSPVVTPFHRMTINGGTVAGDGANA